MPNLTTKILTPEQLEIGAKYNLTAIRLFYAEKMCGDCQAKPTSLVYSKKGKVIFNVCSNCNNSRAYEGCRKLNAQEVFVLQLLLC